MARFQLLLVDSEPRSLRVTGAGLSRHGFTVTPASGAEEALGKLRSQRVDVVVCSASLGEGLATLRRQVLAEDALAPVPFVALADPGGWSPAGGWAEVAATDVVTRPVVTGDLVARVRGAVERGARAGDFQSSLDRMSALDLVEHFRGGRHSGTVLFTGRRDGRLVFHEGSPVDATLGLHSGREAFFRMLASKEGEFEVRRGSAPAQGNLGGDDRALLEEGLAWVESWDAALEQVPPLSAVLEQDAVKVAARQAALPEEAGWLLRLVDGERTVEDLVEASTLGGVAALEILARLYFEGLVSVRARAAEPVRRPRVEEWLNTPPAVALPAVVSSSGPATQTLSREEFAALEGGRPAEASEGSAGAAGLSPEELLALEAAAPGPVPEAGPSTQVLSREEMEAFGEAAVTPAPEAGPSTQVLSREEMEAFGEAAVTPAPEAGPSTQGLSREEMDAFGAAAVTPAPEVGTATQVLSREEMDAFGAAAVTPAAVGPAAAEEPVLPAGFMDEGGFPMGVSLPPVVRRPVLSGRHETPASTSAIAPAAAPPEEAAAEPKSTTGTSSGWVPFERAAPVAAAVSAPVSVEASVPAEQAAPEPTPVPAEPTTPEAAAAPEAPSPSAPPVATAPPSKPEEEDDVAALLKPSRSRWVLGGLALAGIALVGFGAYFGLRPSAPPAEKPPAAPATAAVPTPTPPESSTEPDAGNAADAAPADAVGASAADAADAGAPAAVPVAAAQPPEGVPAPAANAAAAPAGPALVVTPPAQQQAAAVMAAPVPPLAPVAAVPAPAAPQPPAAAVRPAPAAPVPLGPAAAPAARPPAAAPMPAPQPIDIRAAKTPPPQGSTSQDRVAPGLLPRKAPSAVPAPAEGAATAKAASTAAAVHVRGAKQAMQYGLWKLAADSYRKALALGADTPEVKAGLGICLVSSDSGMRGYQEAVVVLRQALAQDEGNARAWLSLGMAYQFLGNNPEAVVAYKRYLALQPNGKSATEVRAMLERL